MENFAQSVVTKGLCDHPKPLTDFNGAAYMGTWYERVHRKDEPFQPEDATCVQAIYYDLEADGKFMIQNSYQGPSPGFSERQYVTFPGICPDETGRCTAGLSHTEYSNYVVVSTDYVSYSLVYSCALKPYLWLLTREIWVSCLWVQEKMDLAKELLPSFDFDSLAPWEIQGEGFCTYSPGPDFNTEFLQ